MGMLALMAQAALAADGFAAPDMPASDGGPYAVAVLSLGLLCVVAFKNAKRTQHN